MSLYKKYIPNNLKQFYGHKIIIKLLIYFKKNKNVPSCFIIYGPKGTGKTSLSRIIYKLLNCKKKNICKKCENNKFNSDYIDIDAASNRKIEEIILLFRKIYTLPLNGKFKIFSIDESQMLSNYSFNYLLKKIEKLPKHVVVLFLTTNIKKIPDTIISRCFILKLEKFNIIEIYYYIKIISKKERIKMTKKSMLLMAENSSGSLRDALVLLEYSYSLSDYKKITSKLVYKITNTINENIIFNFLIIILKNKKKKMNKFLFFLFIKKINLFIFLIKIIEFINKFLFFKSNKKYINYFFINNYKKKYLTYFLKNKLLIKKLDVIRKKISNEIFFFKKFPNKINGFKYILYILTKNT
ncbi:AAA family ATPase [Candidatus Vidania fulgoroideorum]